MSETEEKGDVDMFKHTMAAYRIITEDLNKLRFVFTLATQLIFFAYSIYSICTGRGFLIANCIFAALALGYFIFTAVTYRKNDKESKAVKNNAAKATKLLKLSVNLVTLSIMIYNAYFGITKLTVFSLVMLAFMVISWVVQVFAQIALYYVENRLVLLWHGFIVDFEPAINVSTGISKAVRVVKGEGVEEGDGAFTIPEKSRVILSARVDSDNQQRLEKMKTTWRRRIKKIRDIVPMRKNKGQTPEPIEPKELIHK